MTPNSALLRLLPLLLLAGAPLAPARADDPAPGKQVERTLKTADGEISYLLYLPENYAEEDAPKAFPLMLFLHGRGESNGPLSLVTKWGPPMMAARGDSLPYVLASPQCPRSSFWNKEDQLALLDQLLDALETELRIDTRRVYVTGLSMGGYGTWALTARHPGRFAAAAPVCGGGKVELAENLSKTPIWAWHGAADSVVPAKLSEDLVAATKEAGGKVRLTLLEHIGHNSWSAAYATPELYQWMFKHALPAKDDR